MTKLEILSIISGCLKYELRSMTPGTLVYDQFAECIAFIMDEMHTTQPAEVTIIDAPVRRIPITDHGVTVLVGGVE